jgi:hypothetical protein
MPRLLIAFIVSTLLVGTGLTSASAGSEVWSKDYDGRSGVVEPWRTEKKSGFLEDRPGGNSSYVNQNGSKNAAVTRQNGTNNVSRIVQIGRGNTATHEQEGSNNIAITVQIGRNQTAHTRQVGDGNFSLVGQAGGKSRR